MLLIKEKTSNKYLYPTHNLSDNYNSKVALYKYIFEDSPKLSKYLHTNLNTITKRLQTHQTMSQDPYNLDDSTTISSHPHSQTTINETKSPDPPTNNDTNTNKTQNKNKNPTTNNQHHPTIPHNQNKHTHQETTSSTPPSTDDTTQSPEYAQLPPLPPQQNTTTTSIVHNTNVNINVNQTFQQNAAHTHHKNNSTSLSNNNSNTHNNPYSTPTQKSRNTTITPKITNPYKNKTKPTQMNKTPPTNQKVVTPTNNIVSTNNKKQQNDTTNIGNDNHEEDQHIGLQDFLDLFDNTNPSRDITLETFPNYPQLQTLTNGIKIQLLNLLPNLTYKFFEQCQEKHRQKQEKMQLSSGTKNNVPKLQPKK